MIYDIWFLIYDIWYMIWVFRHHLKKSSRKKTWLLNNKQKSPLLTHRLKMTTCLLFEEGGCQSSVNSSMTCGEQRGSATLQDLDEFEIGGLLSWKDPVDFSEVTHYNVTWVGPKWVGLVVGLGWVGLVVTDTDNKPPNLVPWIILDHAVSNESVYVNVELSLKYIGEPPLAIRHIL